MKYFKYIGTKIIDAMDCDAGQAAGILNRPVEADTNAPGYLVVYADGYKSWSPQKAFDEAYRPTDDMNFGLAIEALKKGKLVARHGWNGKDMYLALVEGSTIEPGDARSGVAFALATEGFKEINILAHIDMRAADGSCVVGWLASQTDMLSDDWFIVE